MYIVLYMFPFSKISFFFFLQLFSSDLLFWGRCTKYPKLTLNIHQSCATSVTNSERQLICFSLRTAVLDLYATLRQVHRITQQKNSWTLHGQRYAIYALLCPRVPYVTTFQSTASSFRLKGYFETHTHNDLEVTLNTTRTMYRKYYYSRVRVPNFSLFRSAANCFPC